MWPYINGKHYPKSYDNIPGELKQKILDNLDEMVRYKNELFKKYAETGYNSDSAIYSMWSAQVYEIDSVVRFLHSCGLMVETGWCGHRKDYFFATHDDALDYFAEEKEIYREREDEDDGWYEGC